MSITLTALQKQRRDTAANWTSVNPTLLAGEIGIESDTNKWKVGTGSAAWTALAYMPGSQLSAYPIVNVDIAAGAEIAVSKLADGTPRQLLQTDAAGTGVEWASNIDVPGTLDVTSAATFDNNVIIQGDLTVNGTETIINTQTLDVEDKNIVIGKVVTPSDVTADGGGITLKGTTDKTINWIDATDAWTFSEHVNIVSTKEYRIAGTKVLDATSLGSGVIGSSLTSVGTIATGVWNGTAINKTYLDATLVSTGDTGTVTSTMILDGTILNADINASAAIVDTKLATIATAGKVSNSATTATDANTASAIVARDASGNFTAGTITAALTGAASSNVLKAGDTMTGALVHPLGAAATPSLTFTGDLDTGVFSPGADQVAVATNGTGRLFVDASGNVCLKKEPANPNFSKSLTVVATDAAIALRANSTGTYTDQGIFFAVDGVNYSQIYNIGDGQLVFRTGSGLSERLRITSAGLVGIGTSTPQGLLHVAGGYLGVGYNSGGTYPAYNTYFGAFGSNFSSGGSEFDIWNTVGAGFAFRSQSGASTQSCLLYIDRTGKVGIGTTSPGVPLDVIADSSAIAYRVRGRASDNVGDIQFTDNGATAAYVNLRAPAANTFAIFTGGSERARIDSSGRLLVGTGSDSGGALFQVNGDRIRVATAKTPASATATGTAGEICWDASYIYVCTATNTWKRTAISTW